jgi:hypothetical protein
LAQGQPSTAAPAPTVKPAKKPAPKAKTSAALPKATDSGPCRIGVISAIGDEFVVQRIGLTVFGNEYTEVPIEGWGIDDLVVTRVRAALPNTAVKRIAYPKGAFAPYDHPAHALFHNSPDLTTIVRQIANNAGCERYVVVPSLPDRWTAPTRATAASACGIAASALSIILFCSPTWHQHI